MPFTSQAGLIDHYDRHKDEFDPPNIISMAEYLRRAERFLGEATSVFIRECVRSSGVRGRIHLLTGEYLAVNPAGFIITYFIANPARHGFASNWMYHLDWCNKI